MAAVTSMVLEEETEVERKVVRELKVRRRLRLSAFSCPFDFPFQAQAAAESLVTSKVLGQEAERKVVEQQRRRTGLSSCPWLVLVQVEEREEQEAREELEQTRCCLSSCPWLVLVQVEEREEQEAREELEQTRWSSASSPASLEETPEQPQQQFDLGSCCADDYVSSSSDLRCRLLLRRLRRRPAQRASRAR